MGLDLNDGIIQASGGAARTLRAVSDFAQDIGAGSRDAPDILVVGVDLDCEATGARVTQVTSLLESLRYTSPIVVAEPEPHIERWYLSDPATLQLIAQSSHLHQMPTVQCQKDVYKTELSAAMSESGLYAPLGGLEYGEEIATRMRIYSAGQASHCLRRFVQSFRNELKAFTS